MMMMMTTTTTDDDDDADDDDDEDDDDRQIVTMFVRKAQKKERMACGNTYIPTDMAARMSPDPCLNFHAGASLP